MTDVPATPLQAEFAPLIISRFEQTYSRSRRMSETAQQNLVHGPLANLETEFTPEILRDALKETLAKVKFGRPTRRWFVYTRRVAQVFQERTATA
jgi:hypothetical protein